MLCGSQALLSVVGAIFLPFLLVSGVWGMNLSGLPDVAFEPLLGITIGARPAMRAHLVCVCSPGVCSAVCHSCRSLLGHAMVDTLQGQEG